MVRRWRVFASSIVSDPRAAHFVPALYIRTKGTSCVEVRETSNLRPLRRIARKEEEEEEEEEDGSRI